MDRIEMLDLSAEDRPLQDQINQAIASVFERGDFINGKDVDLFREELQAYLDIPYIIPCGNGTDALQLCLMALDLPKGGEIITPAYSYAATVEVIALLGYRPVFVDVEPGTFNIDCDLIEAAITDHTCAIMPVHLFGQCADMNRIMAIAEQYDLRVIEDAAQAIGSGMEMTGKGRMTAGSIGDAGGLSFFPSKNLGAYGDAGAITTRHEELATRIRSLANHGQSRRYTHDLIGINSRLDTVQAAVLRVKLSGLKDKTERRRRIAQAYNDGFASNAHLVIPEKRPWTDHVYHQYTLRTRGSDRDEMIEKLNKNHISARIYYPTPLPLQPAYRTFGKNNHFPVAEALARSAFSIPVHPALTDEQVAYTIDTINKICSDN